MNTEQIMVLAKRFNLEELRSAVELLVQERDAAMADAERYRWLRSMSAADWLHRHLNIFNKRLDAFDDVVDAALKGES